jgi:Na+/phosphate symporter
MIIYFSLLIALIGVLMYALVVNPKLQEIGRIMFWTGLLSFLLHFAPGPMIGLAPR